MAQLSSLLQILNLDKEMGTVNKPPKLLWMEKFQNGRTWLAMEKEYIIPRNENGTKYRLSQVVEDENHCVLERKRVKYQSRLKYFKCFNTMDHVILFGEHCLTKIDEIQICGNPRLYC